MEEVRITINSWVLCVGDWKYAIDPARPFGEQLVEAHRCWRESQERPSA